MLSPRVDGKEAAIGQLVQFSVAISNAPDKIAELTNTLTELKVTIKDMQQERTSVKNDVFGVECSLMVETRDSEHAFEMFHRLRSKYPNGSVRVPEGSQFGQIVPQNTPQNTRELD